MQAVFRATYKNNNAPFYVNAGSAGTSFLRAGCCFSSKMIWLGILYERAHTDFVGSLMKKGSAFWDFAGSSSAQTIRMLYICTPFRLCNLKGGCATSKERLARNLRKA